MSTLSPSEKNGAVWSTANDCVSSKHEKCRNIAEEIYKRIDITFQIKKLETGAQSDVSEQSDQIDSNDLSNETDLFACDKDSISSSEAERPVTTCDKYININNNEETKKKLTVYKRPRKRFRKRVKKHQPKPPPTDTECSSDEGAPLTRVTIDNASPRRIYLELKPKPKLEKRSQKLPLKVEKVVQKEKEVAEKAKVVEKVEKVCEKGAQDEGKGDPVPKEEGGKTCDICSLNFRGERGLRRHMTMSHSIKEGKEKSNNTQQRNSTLD